MFAEIVQLLCSVLSEGWRQMFIKSWFSHSIFHGGEAGCHGHSNVRSLIHSVVCCCWRENGRRSPRRSTKEAQRNTMTGASDTFAASADDEFLRFLWRLEMKYRVVDESDLATYADSEVDENRVEWSNELWCHAFVMTTCEVRQSRHTWTRTWSGADQLGDETVRRSQPGREGQV